jgi:hypothetical protein
MRGCQVFSTRLAPVRLAGAVALIFIAQAGFAADNPKRADQRGKITHFRLEPKVPVLGKPYSIVLDGVAPGPGTECRISYIIGCDHAVGTG